MAVVAWPCVCVLNFILLITVSVWFSVSPMLVYHYSSSLQLEIRCGALQQCAFA